MSVEIVRMQLLLIFVVLVLCCSGVLADVVIRGPSLTATLDTEGRWISLRGADGHEYRPDAGNVPFAVLHDAEGQAVPCTSASLVDNQLTVGFTPAHDTVLTYAVTPADDWVVFTLTTVEGTRPHRIIYMQVPVNITENVGDRLNIAWDAERAVCLMATNLQSDCRARGGAFSTLSAETQDAPGPRLEGAEVALIISPTESIKQVLRKGSHEFNLLTNEAADGTPAKDTELVRGSYWFISVAENEVDKVIKYCKLAGINQVMIQQGSWVATVGHYTFNTNRYPNGREGLKNVVDRFHEEGILVGMHTFGSKVAKRDAFVTPVPDRRLLRGVSASWRPTDGLLLANLAEDITAEQTEIRMDGDLRYWPGSSEVADRYWEGGIDKHREVIINDEIIAYDSIGSEGVWNTFMNCRRGAWGTTAAAHSAGDEGAHVGVDGCINGYIIDQETDLMDEVADIMADIFNYCGFDMVYFDGGEDVDRRRFNYYVSNFQKEIMSRFEKRPMLHMGTIMTHHLWHSFARSSTVDTYLNTLHGAIIGGRPPERWPTVRDHINTSVRYMLRMRQNLMPGELGWFGIWPKGSNTDGLQLDELEYLVCKSLGYDVPVSLQTGFAEMESHPLTPEILRMFRIYEGMRINREVDEATREMLQEMDKDFVMVKTAPDASPQFFAAQPAENVGGSNEVRSMVAEMPGGSVATLWHYLYRADVAIPLNPAQVRIVDVEGNPVEFTTRGEGIALEVGPTRNTMLLSGIAPEQALAALAAAEVVTPEMPRVWVRAAEGELVGNMAFGSQVGVDEPEALSGDVLICTGAPSFSDPQPWYAEYTVDIPESGAWTLWARVRYPTGTDDSFGFVQPGEEVTLSGSQVLGNCGMNEEKWHWTGRGAGSAMPPPGMPITLQLEEGPFTFRIYGREGPGTVERNPRLDLLCFIGGHAGEPPTDEEAQAALGE